MHFDKHRNGKVLVDEMGLHEDEVEKIDDSITDELNIDIDEEIDDNGAAFNGSAEKTNAPTIICSRQDGNSK